MNLRIVVLLAFGASLATVGCSSDPASQCHPSDPSCAPSGDDGGASSDAARSSHDSGSSPTDSGVTTGDGGGNGPGEGGGPHDSGMSLGSDGGAGGFAEACMQTTTCPPAYPVCFNYNTKGPHCTKQCTTSADCPAQSPGCSGMGVCRIP